MKPQLRLLCAPAVLLWILQPYCCYAQDVYSQPAPPQIPTNDKFNVNLLQANWSFTQPVKLYSDVDPDMYFEVSTSNGGFTRWSSSLTGYLTADLSTYQSIYKVVIGQRSFSMGTVNGSNVWTDVSATGNTLTYDSNTGIFTFTDRQGVRYTFDGAPFNVQPAGSYQSCVAGAATNSYHVCAVNTSIQYPDGKTITLGYEGTATLISANNYRTYTRLKYARSSNGISMKFGYASNDSATNLVGWLIVSSATLINDAYEFCDYVNGTCTSNFSWPSVSYSYTNTTSPSGANIRVTTATDQLGVVHTYNSTARGNNLVIYKNGPNAPVGRTYLNDQGSSTRGEPSPPGYVDFTDTDGTLYQYRYNDVSGGSYYEVHGTRTSSDGRTISFVGNRQLPRSTVVVSSTDENNNTTAYKYDANFRPTEVDYPEGNATIYTYDARGNITASTERAKVGSGLADVSLTADFPTSCNAPASCNKPTAVTDARNGVTSYSWDQNTGNMLSSTLPVDTNGVAPVHRYAYTPMYAWVTNGAGGYIPSAPQRSMLTEMRTCRQTATIGNGCAGGAADEIVTAYYYGPQSGPNNLQLRGVSVTADGKTRVTCYGYDRLGRKISETSPNANVQVCP